ncbi:SH3 domain-containing protein [Entamoeba marina]
MKTSNPLFHSLNRKFFAAKERIKDKQPTHIDDDYQQKFFFSTLVSALKKHLDWCTHSPQTLLSIGNAFVNFFEPDNDIYNYALQYKSACQIKTMAEDDYCTSYEILYSNAHSCYIQYQEMKERKKKLKERKLDYEMLKEKLEELQKKKTKKGLSEMTDKVSIAETKYQLLRTEIITDMSLIVNMMKRYRNSLFKVVVEIEVKKTGDTNTAMTFVQKLGGEENASPQYVITDFNKSYSNDLFVENNFNTSPRINSNQTSSNSSTRTSTEIQRDFLYSSSPIINKDSLVTTQQNTNSSSPPVDSIFTEEMKLKTSILESVRNQINNISIDSQLQPIPKDESIHDSKDEIIFGDDDADGFTVENIYGASDIATELNLTESNKSSDQRSVTELNKSLSNDYQSSTSISSDDNESNDESHSEIEDVQEKQNQYDVSSSESIHENTSQSSTVTQTNKSSIVNTIPVLSNPLLRVKALYDYEASDETELSLREGDVIDIYNNDGDWWEGELRGQKGLVPANFVEYLK